MLKDIYKSCFDSASLLGDFQSMSKTELANGYCDADDAHDEQKRDQYYSALVLRYWYKIYEFSNFSHYTKLELDEYYSWVSEALDVGLKYRRWRDPSHPLSKDPNGPDKVFQRSFYSTRQRWYKHFNRNATKSDYFGNSIYIDDLVEYNEDDFNVPSADREEGADNIFYKSGNYSTLEAESPTYTIVQQYINKGNILDAVILDAISHQISLDSKGNFSRKNLVKLLNEIDFNYISTFEATYRVDNEKLKNAITDISSIPTKKLYRYITKTLKKVSKDKQVVSMLKG